MRRKNRHFNGFTLIELLTSMFIIATIAAILVPNLRRNIYKTSYVACKTNLRNISTALQLYANDNDAHYPISLDFITPTYMKMIPTCRTNVLPYGYDREDAPPSYTVYCIGKVHGLFCDGVNEPYYSSAAGLMPP